MESSSIEYVNLLIFLLPIHCNIYRHAHCFNIISKMIFIECSKNLDCGCIYDQYRRK